MLVQDLGLGFGDLGLSVQHASRLADKKPRCNSVFEDFDIRSKGSMWVYGIHLGPKKVPIYPL